MVTRWWVVFCASVLWNSVSLHPANGGPSTDCCPCPKDGALALSGTGMVGDLAASGTSGTPRFGGVDDCPCRGRSADSDAASSVFFPNAVRAIRPFVNLEDSKENPDPLLHPEVSLASSVLETLRQATDEEYEDALARDAARSATDGEAAESARNLVTVIINPKDPMSEDDVMSEASHVHEARCINPSLGRSSLRASPYKPVLLTDILNLPKMKSPSYRSWSLFDDSGVGASNVNERVVALDKDDVKSKLAISDVLSNVDPLRSFDKVSLKLPTINLNEPPNLATHALLSELGIPSKIEIPHISNLIPKFSIPHHSRRVEDDTVNADMQNAPSIFHERYTGFARDESKDDDLKMDKPNQFTARSGTPTKISSFIPKLKLPKSNKRVQNENKESQFSDNQDAANNMKKTFSNLKEDKDNNENASSNRLKIPSASNKLPKLNIPNLINREDMADHDIDIKNVANVLKEPFTGFARDEKTEDLLKPIRTKERSKKPPKLEVPCISDLLHKLKTPDFLRSNEGEQATDSQNSASIIKERYTDFTKQNDKIDLKNKPKSIFKDANNILFGPKSIPVGLKITPSENRDAATDFLSNLLKGLEVPNLNNLFSSDLFNARHNDLSNKFNEQKEATQTPAENKTFVTEILDTVPSPSEVNLDHVSFSEVAHDGGINNNVDDVDTDNEEEVEEIMEKSPIKTEIIDHVPNAVANEWSEPEINILTDPEMKAKVNNIDNKENIELNNEMEDLNDESFVESGIIDEFDRESKSDLSDMVNADSNDNMIDINSSQITSFDNLKLNDGDKNVDSEDDLKPLPLRQKIKNTLESLKMRSKINLNKLKGDKLEESKSNIDNKLSEDDEHVTSPSQIEESGPATQVLDTLPSNENNNKLDIEDLQQMSDSLLDKEQLRGNHLSKDNDSELNASVGSQENTDIINKDISDENRDFISEITDASSVDNTMQETNNREVTHANVNALECLEKASPGNTGRADGIDKDNEMISEASERMFDSVDFGNNLRSPLKQSILQPPSLSDLNLFNLPTLDVGDLLHIDNPLPALKLTDMFNSLSTNYEDLDILGLKQKVAPTTFTLKSTLPPLKPLEDINLDILQLKPLNSDLPTIPRLNLNTFKSKLAIPESLQMRPLLLESSVGNKNGVIGAALTFGNDDKKDIGLSNMLEQASLKRPSILGRPLGALPTLDDLRSTVWENAHNLLHTPLETTSRNAVEDTLRSGQVLTENLRVGAENTVKDLQRNLESTLKGVGLGNQGFLTTSSLRSPNDFFEEISRKHEDVNDKLKGISYDLSDRLETLRNNIFDEYRFPYLGSSLLDGVPTLGSPLLLSSFETKPKPKSSSYSNKAKKVKADSDSGTKGKFITRTASSKSKLKMPTAASIPSLKTVKSPTMRTAEPPIFKGLGKESSKTSLLTKRPTLSLFQMPDKNTIDSRPLLKKPTLPKLVQSKVKISFGTTPAPPVLKNKPRLPELTKPKNLLNKDTLTLPKIPKTTSRDKTGLLSSFRDSNGFASEPVSARVKSPKSQALKGITSPINPKVASFDKNDDEVAAFSQLKTDPPGLRLKPLTLNKDLVTDSRRISPTTFKPKSSLITTDGTLNRGLSEPLRNPKRISSWPKTIDDTFLLKVREALKARLAGISQGLNNGVNTRKSSIDMASDKGKVGDVDMARSASNNEVVNAVAPSAMKENTAYTCKMMCTKTNK